MHKKDYDATLAAMKAQRERMKGNPAEALAFLVRLGVLDADGTPSKKYYSTEEIREHKIKKLLE